MNTRGRRYFFSSLFVLLVALTAWMGARAQVTGIVDLFAPTPAPSPKSGNSSAAQIPGMHAETIGAASFVALTAEGKRSMGAARANEQRQRVRITLPNKTVLVCAVTAEKRESGVLVMRGPIEGGSAFNSCSLYEQNGQITGEIEVDAGRFAIMPLGTDGAHAIVEVKAQAFPGERSLKGN